MSSEEQVTETRQQKFQRRFHTSIYLLLLGIFVLGGAFIVAFDSLMPSDSKLALQEGQLAPRTVLAPRGLRYESDALTKAKRQAEMEKVDPIYDPPDVGVSTEQSQRARQILAYLENVLFDEYATAEQKRDDIAAITDLNLDLAVVDALLSIDSSEAWRRIDDHVIRVLEGIMNGGVREDTIETERANLPNLINPALSEAEAKIIEGIVSDLIKVNAFYNEELTHQAELQAAEAVPAEVRIFARGEMIIREGDKATEAQIEALDRFGLLEVKQRKTSHFLGGLLAMSLVTTLLGVYIKRFYPEVFVDSSFMILLGTLFLLFLAGAQLVDPEDSVQPYYYPASALAILVATLIAPQLAIVMVMALAALIGFMVDYSLEFTVVVGFTGMVGVLSLGRTERINAYFVAGSMVGLSSACVAGVFALSADSSVEFFTVFSQIVGSILNGLFSAATALVGLYFISSLLNIPTSLKIVELLQPNHPLLQRLLREAPGTYQHSLQVANLAELGAERVDANTSLLRVAAMYHDVGKILNPYLFVENQAGNANPHDDLNDPVQSARIIIGHVKEGDRLARRYHLPTRIRDFIVEHHGTSQVMYFYREALKRAEQTGEDVSIEEFTYPGPRPQSRETAILMLADGCESSVRARRPESREDIQETVDYIFQTRLQEGQLDESGLTLNDLRALRDTFLAALQGVFHPRIAYPGTPSEAGKTLPEGKIAQLPPGEEKPVDTTAVAEVEVAEGVTKPEPEPVIESEAESNADTPDGKKPVEAADISIHEAVAERVVDSGDKDDHDTPIETDTVAKEEQTSDTAPSEKPGEDKDKEEESA